jgi:hydroxyacylglutathione hydrolase
MIKIFTVVVTPFAQNCRILLDTDTDEIITIDPGGDVPLIISFLREMKLLTGAMNYSKVLLTHSHIDHGGGVEDFLSSIANELSQEPELLFHRDNDLYRDTISTIAAHYGLSPSEFKNVPEADRYIADEETVTFGKYSLRALFTPGHAPGHLSFYIDHASISEQTSNGYPASEPFTFEGPVLIAGDTLFEGSIGRTDLPGGNHELLLESISEKLMILPDDTLVLSGHGGSTTIGRERNTNPFLSR